MVIGQVIKKICQNIKAHTQALVANTIIKKLIFLFICDLRPSVGEKKKKKKHLKSFM